MPTTLPRTKEGKFVKGITYSPQTTFKPGQEAHNKGFKFPGTGNKASFSKGHKPHNTLYNLATRIRTTSQGRSYEYIRLKEGKWEYLQKYRWTNEVGPIPEGMLLRCKTKYTLNCDPENWIMITKAQNAYLNRFECDFKTIICKVCSTPFETRSRQAKYCSDGCRKVGNLALVRQWHIDHPKPIKEGPRNVSFNVRNCVVCDGAYFPQSNIHKTCSDGCRTIYMSEYHQKYKAEHPAEQVKIVPKHCSKCGHMFTPNHNHGTICPECKTTAPRQIKCLECGTEFTSVGKGAQLLCSDNCKRLRKNRLRAKYGYNRKPVVFKTKLIPCETCNKEFIAEKGYKYCSNECRKIGALAKQTRYRKLKNENAVLNGTQRMVSCTCSVCHRDFESKRKVKFCSDDCRLELKRQKGTIYNYGKKKIHTASVNGTPKLQAKDFRNENTKLNKRNPKAEKEAMEAMLELNRNAPKHDGDIIKAKKIKSPDLSKMEYKVVDKRLRITRYFKTEEKYLNYLKNNSE